ncbi:MAG: biosynthetic-type acetolactate synthase large subunit [Candidatus Binatus sp.]|uniref:biosynthetic-type acetolactate synthase large subunit n=1 Tax=Candidatus Binatus sp. TaxID=2811406 RepID=UPI00271BE02B|nr:biosynthetic-type acetolactate synthase large subunit [Candidatus Binatus sp.]MDO8434510.1 biosynthetic-type acetolactate synthase large subunit [Candidatus Binatus sp.]
MKKLTGAQIVIESLIAEGVDTIFGYPGGAILPTYDALLDSPIKHVLVRHEQGATHMAEGYARVSGRPGVVIVTSGPGATNAVTGIADAYMDSTPMVVLSGQVSTAMIGNDAFQEVDFVGITRPCTKHNFLVKNVKDVARIIKEAFYIAGTGRPGPVVVDLPKDVQMAEHVFKYPDKIELRGYKPTIRGNPRQIERAIEAIEKSSTPLFYVGGGVQWSGAAPELRELIHGLGIPVTETLMGLGSYPASDSLRLGMLGMHGSYGTNTAVCNTDCLIAVGARFDDRVTGKISEFAPKAETIIHIDIDPSSISKNVRVDIPIVGDIKSVLGDMLSLIKNRESIARRRVAWSKWHQQILQWKKEKPLYENGKHGEDVSPHDVIAEMHNITKGDCIVATDVGQHQMWVAQMFPFEHPRSWLTSGGLGTMGYGLPAGIGATFAAPDKKVVVVSGDGSIQMNIQELGTAVQYGVDIKVIILNNYVLGMVRQWQEKFYAERYSYSTMSVPNFVKLADAYGAHGFRVEKSKDLVATMREAFATPGPVLIDVVIPKEEAVMPMIPPGGAMSEMLFA